MGRPIGGNSFVFKQHFFSDDKFQNYQRDNHLHIGGLSQRKEITVKFAKDCPRIKIINGFINLESAPT